MLSRHETKAKPLWEAFAILICASLCGSASAQNVIVEGVARSAGAAYFMHTVCGRHVAIDAAMAERVNNDQLELGVKMFGRERKHQIFDAEVTRRRREIDATGESAWCAYQRASMRESGLGFLFR